MEFLADLGAGLGQRVFQFLRQRSHGEIEANQQSRIFGTGKMERGTTLRPSGRI